MMFALCTAVTTLRPFWRAYSNAKLATFREAVSVMSLIDWTTPETICNLGDLEKSGEKVKKKIKTWYFFISKVFLVSMVHFINFKFFSSFFLNFLFQKSMIFDNFSFFFQKFLKKIRENSGSDFFHFFFIFLAIFSNFSIPRARFQSTLPRYFHESWRRRHCRTMSCVLRENGTDGRWRTGWTPCGQPSSEICVLFRLASQAGPSVQLCSAKWTKLEPNQAVSMKKNGKSTISNCFCGNSRNLKKSNSYLVHELNATARNAEDSIASLHWSHIDRIPGNWGVGGLQIEFYRVFSVFCQIF